MTKEKIDQKISYFVNQYLKILINICWYVNDQPKIQNSSEVSKDGHFYLVTKEKNKLNFSDGEGNWDFMHKIEKKYLNLIIKSQEN